MLRNSVNGGGMSAARLFSIATAVLACISQAAAQSEAGFYAGKTIRIVIGAGVGGEYGLYSQLVAQHIGRFIPGNPALVVQSMPGAGGMNAVAHVANVAEQDGTVLLIPPPHVVQEGLLNPKARFDPRTLQWIGRLREQMQVAVASGGSKANSLADARARELTVGATAANNPTGLNARLLNELAGTRFKIVTGYKSSHDISIAWERGEVDVLTTGWDNIVRRYSNELQAGLIRPLYLYAMSAPPSLSRVPLITEFGRTADERAFLQIYTVGTEIGRSVVAPGNVPAARVQLVRSAFQQMLDSSEFKAATTKANITIERLDGEKLQAVVDGVMALTPDTIGGARQFYNKLGGVSN
jgi:tripartite-type tricarboxylate transporter receptor subunit TctC